MKYQPGTRVKLIRPTTRYAKHYRQAGALGTVESGFDNIDGTAPTGTPIYHVLFDGETVDMLVLESVLAPVSPLEELARSADG